MPTMGAKQAYEKARELYDQGLYWTAFRTTEQLYRQNPHFPPVVALHVAVLLRMQRNDEGVLIARRALRHITNKPHRVLVLNALVDGLTQTGQLDDALALMREEIERQPEEAALVSGLGHVLLLAGNKDEATALIDDAFARGMRTPGLGAVFGRAVLRTDRRDEGITLIESLRDEHDDTTGMSWHKAHNALGHLYDRAKRYDEAFASFSAANACVPAAYSDGTTATRVRAHHDKWTPESIEAAGRVEVPEGAPTPVFIVGMPRSGTTLTEQIIDAHPEGYGAGELGLISELFRESAKNPRAPYEEGPAAYERKKLEEAARIYREQTAALAGDAGIRVITDKAPMNFWYLGFISLILPDARIIHCRREPRDNCLSCYFQSLNAGHSYSFDLRNCGLYYRHYREVTDHYTGVLKDDRTELPLFENHYEDTVADQEAKTRALLDFAGLPFHEDTLRFHESGRVALTLSNDQVRQPIYTSSTKRYERYASHIAPLVEALGDLIPEHDRVAESSTEETRRG